MLNLKVNPKIFPHKITLTLVEPQQLPEIEKADSKDEISCLNKQFTIVEEKYASSSKQIETR